MGLVRKFKRAVRGEVSPQIVLLEALRRGGASITRWRELARLNESPTLKANLAPAYARLPPSQLVSHFRSRTSPQFFLTTPSFAQTHARIFPTETEQLIESANQICDEHCWPLLGFGEKDFGDPIQWRRDPLSGFDWPLEYHRNVRLMRSDGSDARVLWELNRMGHLLKLACAYRLTDDEKFAAEFFIQLRSWDALNPYGRGVNWTCAMEVALRSVNLLACFEFFRHSKQLNELSLSLFLDLLYQHGTYIRSNLEFSYIATSNHYLSDVVGLLWIGVMLPELAEAKSWREFGLREMLLEMDKQVLEDGCDFESSTGYHRFVLELFLYSFLLCRRNGIEIPDRHWEKLRLMLNYVRAYLRPDGFAPLMGDTDSGQVLPIVTRRADDHAYLLSVGAIACDAPDLKSQDSFPPELLWLCGEDGVETFTGFKTSPGISSAGSSAGSSARSSAGSSPGSSVGFRSGGTYVMRQNDHYLCFNASGPGINGRGSHGHNDALSIEVSVSGRAFIVDPGTYVYSADLQKRHQFRSTAYHSTIEIDGIEQNSTNIDIPFVIGSEATPQVLEWETSATHDRVSALHLGYGGYGGYGGYARLALPVTHKRTVTFDKSALHWIIEDELTGEGEHEFKIRFHFDAGLQVITGDTSVTATDLSSRANLTVTSETLPTPPVLEEQAVSRDYGSSERSVTACWRLVGKPTKLIWKLQSHSL